MRTFKGQQDRIRVEVEAKFDDKTVVPFVCFFKPLPTSRTPDLMEDGLDHQISILKEFLIDWEIRDNSDELIPFDEEALSEFLDILPYYVAARHGLLLSVSPENSAKN